MNKHHDYLGAEAAARHLGVKRETLYAYTSRGLVRSVPGPRGRARRYLRADLEALRARRDARTGHTAAAASALRFGPPVLESSVSWLTDDGPIYRGMAAIELAESDTSFESVAELLWAGVLPPDPPTWETCGLGIPIERVEDLLPAGTPPLAALSLVAPALAAHEPGRFDTEPEGGLSHARRLVRRLAASLGFALEPARVERALRARSVAHAVATALGARRGRDGVRAINRALVLLAEHELNASAFSARVVASTGADVHACVSAALAALSGPRHGGATEAVEALVAETSKPEAAPRVVAARARRGEAFPGFGHAIYRRGDPRAAPLLAVARELAPRSRRLDTLLALIGAMAEAGRPAPNCDVALVALVYALGLPTGSGAGLFAVGRSAGWIAHIFEQYAAGYLVRPRARLPETGLAG